MRWNLTSVTGPYRCAVCCRGEARNGSAMVRILPQTSVLYDCGRLVTEDASRGGEASGSRYLGHRRARASMNARRQQLLGRFHGKEASAFSVRSEYWH